jgi:hypothetical protein
MDRCPAEVLHAICALLPPRDVAALRLVRKDLAVIGAHHLVDKVRFHSSQASIKRLRRISKHAIFSHSVRVLHWEAARLESEITLPQLREAIRTIATATGRTTRDAKPKVPPPGASLREQRLFRRNLAKWASHAREAEQNVRSQFRKYKRLVASEEEAEVALLSYNSTLTTAIRRFPRLKEVHFDNEPGKCHHMFSQRFGARFEKVEFPIPFDRDTGSTVWQIRELLVAIANSTNTLEKLVVHSMAPSFFQFLPAAATNQIHYAVSSLKHISLGFRLNESHEHVDNGSCFAILDRGGLKNMLEASPLLEHLEVRFDHYPEGGVTALTNVLGDAAWPKLRCLHISQLSTTEEELMACLIRQRSLKEVAIAWMTLTKGSWEQTVQRMQRELSVEAAEFDGFLMSEDPEYLEFWNTDMYSPIPMDGPGFSDLDSMDEDERYEIMMDDRERLGTMLDIYITKGNENSPNPFYAYDWTDDEM